MRLPAARAGQGWQPSTRLASLARRQPPRWWLLLVSLVAVGGCATPLTDTECSALLDRYTERLVRDENPAANDQLIAEKQAAARQLARDDPRFEFDACASKVSRSQFECAMQANDVNSIEQCLVM